jgi:hypothetical protein
MRAQIYQHDIDRDKNKKRYIISLIFNRTDAVQNLDSQTRISPHEKSAVRAPILVHKREQRRHGIKNITGIES